MSYNLTELLNKIEALIDCGFATVTSLANEIGEPQPRVTEWITATNRSEPRGSVAFKLHEWCQGKTLDMAVAGREKQTAYRAAFKAVTEKRKEK